jgi:hypothetical protein
MNRVLNIPRLGFPSGAEREAETMDGLTTRPFKGNGMNALLVPGCLEVHQVRMPGLLHEAELAMDVPMDGNDRPQYLTLQSLGYDLVPGPDGIPRLERARNCNDGVWQKPREDEFNIFVVGRWNEEVSPPLPESIPVPEVSHRRVGVEVGGPAESITRGRRAEPKE